MRGTGERKSRAALSQTGGSVTYPGVNSEREGANKEGRKDSVSDSGAFGKR